MSMFSAFNINATGMTAERYRMDVISENVANANTTRTADGTPYRRKVVSFSEKANQASFQHILGWQTHIHSSSGTNANMTHTHEVVHTHTGLGYTGNGVRVNGLYEDHETEMNMVYDPSHPDADENGYVTYPNVNIITEMTNMIDASRAYEANATAFNATKAMVQKGLEIGS
ncbi:MAG TPA: flagellar basal body rod protein FlgC [Lachnospiraceae bacterium]|nr:flagellar basal body rod protein FlgC [Lachnospiraceae bacterium]